MGLPDPGATAPVPDDASHWIYPYSASSVGDRIGQPSMGNHLPHSASVCLPSGGHGLVLSWRPANTLDGALCLEALDKVLQDHCPLRKDTDIYCSLSTHRDRGQPTGTEFPRWNDLILGEFFLFEGEGGGHLTIFETLYSASPGMPQHGRACRASRSLGAPGHNNRAVHQTIRNWVIQAEHDEGGARATKPPGLEEERPPW